MHLGRGRRDHRRSAQAVINPAPPGPEPLSAPMPTPPPLPAEASTIAALVNRAADAEAKRPWFERLLRQAFPIQNRREKILLAALRALGEEAARDRAALAGLRQHVTDGDRLIDGLRHAVRASEIAISEQGQAFAQQHQEGLHRLLRLDQLAEEGRSDLLAFGRVQAREAERLAGIEHRQGRDSAALTARLETLAGALRTQISDTERENQAALGDLNRALTGLNRALAEGQARFEHEQQGGRERIEALRQQIAAVAAGLTEVTALRAQLAAQALGLGSEIAAAARQSADTAAQLSLADRRLQAVESRTLTGPAFERFYRAFEDRFRGTRQEISSRAAVYLPDLEAHGVCGAGRRASARMADLGCGRGELLELLVQAGADGAIGIDGSPQMIEICREHRLPVEGGDALEFLRRQPDRSFAALTALHLVEHLPFSTLLALLNEAHRVLEPGGLLILETPNCGNLLVASTNFHLDPTHRHPLPPLLLSFSLEQAGFGGIQTRLLHPYGPEYPVADSSPLAARFNEFLYGPQDYAVLATNA